MNWNKSRKLMEKYANCPNCGNEYYTLDKLIYDKNKKIKGRNNG